MANGIALTGATGHLGYVLLAELLKRGYRVRALVRNYRPDFPASVEQVAGGLEDVSALSKFTEGMRVFVHSAALISVAGDVQGLVHKTNVVGSQNALKAAKLGGVERFIYIGSVHAFQNRPHLLPLDEERPMVEQGGAYDTSKSFAQQWVLAQNSEEFQTLALCPTSMIGPPDLRPSLLGQAIMDIVRGKIPAVFPGGFDFCDVRDVAVAVANAVETGRGGQAYLLGGKWYSMREFGQCIGEICGRSILLPELPFWMGKALIPMGRIWAKASGQKTEFTAEALHILKYGPRLVCSGKAQSELNYQCRELKETLKDTLEFFGQA